MCSHLQLCFEIKFMYPFYMLSLSGEKIYKGLRLRPITYMYVFNKGLRLRLYVLKRLRCLLSDSQQLIQHVDYAFSINLQDVYLHIPIVKHHGGFIWFVWHNMSYQWQFLPFGLATATRVFRALIKPILSLCHHKGFHIVIYLDDIIVLICSKWAGQRAH